MRKRNVLRVIDTLVWLSISLLPLIIYSFTILGHSGSYMPLYDFAVDLANYFDAPLVDSLVTNVTDALEIDLGQYQIFIDWFVSMHIVHFAVDIVLFIFRLFHKLLDRAMSGLE